MAVSTYHNTPNGPRPCRDKNNLCPYKKQGFKHFRTQEAAQRDYELQMMQTFGAVKKMSKNEKVRQSVYHASDEIRKTIDSAQTISREIKQEIHNSVLNGKRRMLGRLSRFVSPVVNPTKKAYAKALYLNSPSGRREIRYRANVVKSYGQAAGQIISETAQKKMNSVSERVKSRMVNAKSRTFASLNSLMVQTNEELSNRASDIMTTKSSSSVPRRPEWGSIEMTPVQNNSHIA